MKMSLAISALVLLIGLNGCGEGEKAAPAAAPPPAVAGPTLPPGTVLTQAPADAKDVSVLKKEAKEGDEVVIRGQVGGDKAPIVNMRAIMSIVDMKLPACNLKPGDDCATPWDFCCETAESLKANSATIQFTGDNGRPLMTDLRTVNGLGCLSVVVVKGKVMKREKDNLIINASGIYVEKPSLKK
jgi:hypothetical protein